MIEFSKWFWAWLSWQQLREIWTRCLYTGRGGEISEGWGELCIYLSSSRLLSLSLPFPFPTHPKKKGINKSAITYVECINWIALIFDFWLFISWFAVHPVSMNNTNHLVNSDNMGYASYLFEQEKNKGLLPGEVGIFYGYPKAWERT